MYNDSNFNQIAKETKSYSSQMMETKPDPPLHETDPKEMWTCLKKELPVNIVCEKWNRIVEYVDWSQSFACDGHDGNP